MKNKKNKKRKNSEQKRKKRKKRTKKDVFNTSFLLEKKKKIFFPAERIIKDEGFSLNNFFVEAPRPRVLIMCYMGFLFLFFYSGSCSSNGVSNAPYANVSLHVRLPLGVYTILCHRTTFVFFIREFGSPHFHSSHKLHIPITTCINSVSRLEIASHYSISPLLLFAVLSHRRRCRIIASSTRALNAVVARDLLRT
jgi:hypothetical protein